jgi:hypothetical protein
MKIEQRLERLKQRIAEVIKTDTLDENILEFQVLTTDELIHTGFIVRMINWIINWKEVPGKEIDEFFLKRCANIDPKTIGGLDIIGENMTIGAFIDIIKIDFVRRVIGDDLILFLKKIKCEITENDEKF